MKRFNAADYAQLVRDLEACTAGLLYMTESESPFAILDWADVKDKASLEQKIITYAVAAIPAARMDAAAFFEKIISNALSSGDEIMMVFADRYRSLYAFLKANFACIEMYVAGKITVHLFIACTNDDDDDGYVVLYTKGIET